MAVAEYPMVSTSASNPRPLFFDALTEEFRVHMTIYDDNGADFALQAGGSGKRTWILRYNGLERSEAAILDAHVASAAYDPENGSGRSFNFRDRDTAVLYTNVRYAAGGYVRNHTNIDSQSREVILEKRP